MAIKISGSTIIDDSRNIVNAGIVTSTSAIIGTGVTVNSSGINVTGVVTATTFSGNLPTTDLTGTITNAQLAGSIANSKLVNDSVSFGGVSLDLGASDATPAFDLSDATAYPTSSLVGTITNAQLAGSIANAKLVNDSVSFGGVSLDLGASDATPAFNLSDATAYPYTSLTGITTEILGDTTPQLGGNLDINSKFITGTGGINVTGVVTATSFEGNGSALTGIDAASFLFNTGITSSVSTVATGVGSTILTLPSTAGKQYIIHSILASNIAVGNTEVNFVGAFDFNGGEKSYFANQIPVPTGTSVEMLKQPQVLNPNNNITVRSTDFDRVGSDNIINVYVSYEEKTSTDLIGVGLGTVGLALTSITGIYTSSTYPSVVQSIRLVNKVDTGPKMVSVSISNGVTTSFLVDNLIVPKYGSIEILDNPKSIQTNDVVQVQLDEGASINVQLSAKKITN